MALDRVRKTKPPNFGEGFEIPSEKITKEELVREQTLSVK